ncbi:hypothetical protein COB55_00385 [Candidatus Wolfebacteria bacterium]|nr:MAG: hypothetical protein COB55_00385 [Candidatus Wolfebacteria bacterium]
MKIKDIQSIVNRIIEELVPNFTQKGLLIVSPISDGILRGFSFEGSSFNKESFYVDVFVQPLYVPGEVIDFNLGRRILGENSSDRWELNEKNVFEKLFFAIKSQGLPVVNVETPEALCSWIDSLPPVGDVYSKQAKAYSLAYTGRFDEAIAELASLKLALDLKVPWMVVIDQRADQLLELLRKNPSSVNEKMKVWSKETLGRLKL